MATESSLNQLVKGAPPPDTKVPPVAPLPPLAQSSSEILSVTKSRPRAQDISANANADSRRTHASTPSITDTSHLSSLPSSPPQIYLNLLILEASLRSQYLHLLSRRRLNTFFLLLLLLWNGFFTWALFLRPREDGTGLGGSVYWVVETLEKIFFIGGIVTVLLVKATGQWERGIRWPRRWLGTTNRGLRGFNLRVVVIKGKWWSEMLGHFAFLLPFGLWREAGGRDWHWVEAEDGRAVEEDLAKGGNHIMLLLLPKNFSSEFRENWEGYRTEYWERENERRALLKKKVRQTRRSKAKETGGWQWWTGVWRLAGASSGNKRRDRDLEKHPQKHHHHHNHHHGLSEKDALIKSSRRRSVLRSDSHSRQSSRSSTPQGILADLDGITEGKPLSQRVRRASSVSSTSSVRKSTKGSLRRADGMLSPLTASATPADDDGSAAKEKRSKRRDRGKGAEQDGDKDRNSNGDGDVDSRPTTPESPKIFSRVA